MAASKEQDHEYYLRNAERIRAKSREYYSRNAETRREYNRQYARANAEAINASKRRRYLDKNGTLYLNAKRGNLKRNYGITPEQKQELFERQRGVCAACGTDQPGSRKGWHLDHCHSTKQVRGILCHPCNLSLGHVKDSIERLQQLIAYLQKGG